MKKSILINTALLFSSFLTQAQTAYISNSGSGNGYSINSPAPLSQLNNLLADTVIDRIELQPGLYKQTDALYLSSGEHPIEVVGLDRATFTSNFNYYSGSNSGIVISRSNIKFKNISFLNTRHCFRIKSNDVSNVRLEDISANNTMSCVEIDYNATKNITDISINNLKSIGYYKAGVRINGTNTSGVSITNSVFDGLTSTSDLERSCYISGISIAGLARNILIDNVSIANNIGRIDNCGSYQQGDGIMINTGTSDIVIKNTIISNSKDADLDIKGENVTLENITSTSGKEARYNFKLWNNSFTCNDCYISSANNSAIQAINAQVTFTNSTFKVKEDSRLCDMRNYNVENATVDFKTSNFSYYGDLSFKPHQLAECE
ncbi:hypothetical protein A2I98_12245 [Pseudoalteromonas agarivorans]|uniref:Right handed beta helix domain-containing protein n=1 Tax=Pseudoalteromonas agarivorans TaxID=176102 RepID=A0ABR5VU25_9GAMM|nr:hypothetical protein [Pseudoalteromonas telluritireducens]KYL34310.1 hypothetical protein A2I98_12245 [Pseudoalteromonas telluritireducens]